MFRKLSRGTINILTGWVEVPKNIAIRWKDSDPFSGFIWGGIEGIGWGFARTVGGVYEVISFPFPYPDDYPQSDLGRAGAVYDR
jgi:putative exosortase-associated protein (TIGR04073 family)